MHVVHVLDTLSDAGPGLWGKERVVAHLLEAQRASGRYVPSLAVFVESSLADVARERGFAVAVLSKKHERFPVAALRALRGLLARSPQPLLVHSHEYKANVVARILRRRGARMRALVSTSHAWFDDSRALAFYNRLDRWTAAESDVVTVADRMMALRFPRNVRAEFVANGLPGRARATATERARARERFDFGVEFVVAYIARTSVAKGVLVFCDAARASIDTQTLWAIAGSGNEEASARDAGTNTRYLGFVSDTDALRSAIDCYVQASYVEGLSLSLLEAMRAGLPIVATDAGSTRLAIRDGIEGLIVAPGDARAIARAVARIAADPAFALMLADAAARRFADQFSLERQVQAFDDLYRVAIARKNGHASHDAEPSDFGSGRYRLP